MLSIETAIVIEELKIKEIESKLSQVVTIMNKVQSGVPVSTYYDNYMVPLKEVIPPSVGSQQVEQLKVKIVEHSFRVLFVDQQVFI